MVEWIEHEEAQSCENNEESVMSGLVETRWTAELKREPGNGQQQTHGRCPACGLELAQREVSDNSENLNLGGMEKGNEVNNRKRYWVDEDFK